MENRTEMEGWQDAIILKHLADSEAMPMDQAVTRTGREQEQILDRINKLEEISEVFQVPMQELLTNPRTSRGGKIGYPKKRWDQDEEGNLVAVAKKGELTLIEMARGEERPPASILKTLRKHGVDMVTIIGSPEQKKAERLERDRKAALVKTETIMAAINASVEPETIPEAKADKKLVIQKTLDFSSESDWKSMRYGIQGIFRELKELSHGQTRMVSLLIEISECLKRMEVKQNDNL
jgi:hypothetical protein